MEQPLISAKGILCELLLFPDRIGIVRKDSGTNILYRTLTFGKDICIKNISSILFKAADESNGYIQFEIFGSTPSSENTVMFNKSQQPHIEELRDKLQTMIPQKPAPQSNGNGLGDSEKPADCYAKGI